MAKNLFQTLSPAQTEEELKNFFAKRFKIKLQTKNFIDLYTPQILFEFKLDSNLQNHQILAKIVAQTLYYVRRLKFGSDFRPVTQFFAIVTKNFAAIFQTDSFSDFFSNNDRYDWDLAPSSPCKILTADLANSQLIINANIFNFSIYEREIAFSTEINNIFNGKTRNPKKITEQNFEQIFLYWQKLFGNAVKNGRKPSEYFITDIEQGKSEDLKNSVLFRMNSGELVEKFIKPATYNHFWDMYDKIYSAQEIIAIRQKMDRMTEINLRRRTGEFYTPIPFADKAFDYLTRTVGKWWKNDNLRLWDMAAGTGNLEFNFSEQILNKCYISTLIKDDADYCKRIFHAATVFQFDFLNDDLNKLPDNLRADLINPDIHWIIYINPPYATANDYSKKNYRNKVSDTKIKTLMEQENITESSRELMVQFLYRISRDFAGKKAWLGMFSSLRYIKTINDEKFREKYFSYKFESGFMFSSKNFDGCNGEFPVGFLIWNLSERIPLESQEIILDVYNSDVEKIAEKFFAKNSTDYLNKWFIRPRGVKKFPPMSSALNVGTGVHSEKVI